MENQEIKVVMNGDEKVLTILNGSSQEPINQKAVKITGNIKAVADFLKHRSETVDVNDSHIIVDEEGGIIALVSKASFPSASLEVSGQLSRPKHLDKLSINGQKVFTLKEISDVLRMHRFLFAELDKYTEVVNKLLNFKAKVESNIVNERNTSNGSSNNSVKKVVDVEQIYFKVKTALYVGGDEKVFGVDICCDVTDGNTRFWLESIDLVELELSERKAVFKTVLDEVSHCGIATIYK